MQSKGLLATVTLAVSLLVASCSHDPSQIRDARADAAMNAAARLQGRWVLTSFQSATSLDPVLQLMVNEQVNRMTVDFNGQAIRAQGPGVTVNRTFKVVEAYVDHFKATIFDVYGVGTDVVGDFTGNTMLVTGLSDPWRGQAGFRRP